MFWRNSGSMTARSASVTCSSVVGVGEEVIGPFSQTRAGASPRA